MRKWLGLGVAAVVVGAIGFVAWALPHRRLAPTGPHRVDTRRWVTVDPDRPDPLADRGGPRRIPVQAWFPADAPRGPVVVFVHGVLGRRHAYRTWIRELASWGYTVVAADHPPVALLPAFPDLSGAPRSSAWRRLMRTARRPATFTRHEVFQQAHDVVEADVRHLLAEIPGHLGVATDRVLLAGHSFGGGLAASMSGRIPGCVGVVSLDGPPFGEPDVVLQVPLLVLTAGRTRRSRALDAEWGRLDAMLSAAEGPLYHYDLPTAGHLELSDFGLRVRPSLLARVFGPAQFGPGSLDDKLRAVADVSRRFADRYLRGDPTVDVDEAAQQWFVMRRGGQSAAPRAGAGAGAGG